MAYQDTLVKVARLLQPKGRAFKIPFGGNLEKLYKAIMTDSPGGFGAIYKDALQIANDQLPDNADFDINDAHDWYRRLGIYDSGSVSLSDMKAAISQKMSFPLTPLNKQNYLFIQGELIKAGFDVYVHENRFDDGMGGFITKTPTTLLAALTIYYGVANMGLIEFGQTNFNGMTGGVTKCVNYLEEDKDNYFNVGNNYRSTFYIGGDFSSDMNLFTNVDINRKTEFRQLILKLKAQQLCGFLLINYV
jgi:hypothetical protein